MLNPSLPIAWGFSALTYTYLGDLEEAARRFSHYQRLSPLHPYAFFFNSGLILLALNRRDYPQAVQLGRRCLELHPNFCTGLKHYLAALGHAGCKPRAAEVLARLLAIAPDFTVEQFLARCPFDRESDREYYAEGLRQAGVPLGSPPSGRNGV